MRRILIAIAISSGLLVFGRIHTAEACTPPRCLPGHLVPAEGKTAPANLPAIYWRPMYDHGSEASDPDPSLVEMTDADGEVVPLTAVESEDRDYLLELDAPLVEGERYQVADASECSAGTSEGPQVDFRATAEAPLPDALGTVEVSSAGRERLTLASSGSCAVEVDAAVVRVRLDPAEAAIPWRDVLHFETIVDGEPWRAADFAGASYPPGASWKGRGEDALYHVCEDQPATGPGLAEGAHEVVFRATLPGTEIALETEPATVRLDCGNDAPAVDGGAPSADGDAGIGQLATESNGCTLSGGAPKPGAALLLAVVLFACTRRRTNR